MRTYKFRAWWKDTMKPVDDFWDYSIDALNDGEESPFIISQFTGLLDKNGKEIYEGDIVSFVPLDNKHFNAPYKPFVVFWKEEEARFSEWSPRDAVIIVGNIYENPELVKP